MRLIGVILNPGNSGAQLGELHDVGYSEPSLLLLMSKMRKASAGPRGSFSAFRINTACRPGRLMHAAAAVPGPRGRATLCAAVSEAESAADATRPLPPQLPLLNSLCRERSETLLEEGDHIR